MRQAAATAYQGVVLCRASDRCKRQLGLSATMQDAPCLLHLCPDSLKDELAALLQRHAQQRTPFIASTLINGMRTILLFRPLAEEKHERVVFECLPDSEWHRLESEIQGTTIYRLKYRDPGPLADLTLRELEVLKLIGDGMTTREIAQTLHRSKRTIQGHRISLGKKLKCRTKTELAKLAFDAGLQHVSLDELATYALTREG